MEIKNYVNHTSNQFEVTKDQKQNKDYTSLGAKGQVIEGVVTNVSEQVSIDFNGTEIAVSKSAIKDAREGEIRKFEIMDVSKQSIVLKEVQQGISQDQKQKNMLHTTVGEDTNRFTELLEKTEHVQETEEDEKESEHMASVKGRMTGQDVLALETEFMSLEKYNLERLDKALLRIKKERLEENQYLEAMNEKHSRQKETMEQIALHNVVSNMVGGAMSSKVAEQLEQAGLPVTQENVTMISNALSMANVAPDLSQDAMQYMIDLELPPTIENVYHAQYAGGKTNNAATRSSEIQKYYTPEVVYDMQGEQPVFSQEDWEKIEQQVKQIVEEAAMQDNPKILDHAKWLFQNQLPITKESLLQLEQLFDLKEHYDGEATLVDIVENFALGGAPKDTLLWRKRQEASNQSVEVFLAELETAWKDLDNKKEWNKEDFSKRRQIEEIRFKMTLQAADRMKEKGISLDLASMEQVVDELRQMEEEYYEGILKEQHVDVTAERIQCLRDTTDSVWQIKQAPMYVLGETLEEKDVISLLEFRKQAISKKDVLEKAGESYEALMTRPRADMGDSMRKAFGNIEQILEELDLEPTVANERAVKILAHNQMELTKENIYAMKEHDAQVNRFIADLHPAVTVELIKRNINPLHTPIVQLNEEILAIKEELGVTGDEKYSKYLWQLEHKEGISPEDRKQYIGMYRLLNNIQKSDGAAVGYVLNTKREVTLNNLLSAITSLKRGTMDVQMDEQTGFAQLKYTREPLVLQVNESFQKEEKQQENAQRYFEMLTKDALEEISPSKLEKLLVDGKGKEQNWDRLMEKTVEQFVEDLKKQEKEQEMEYQEEVVKSIRSIAENSETAISFLKSCEMPVTIENIFAVQSIFSEQSLFRQVRERFAKGNKIEQGQFDQALFQLADCLEDEQTMQEGYRALEEKIEAMVNAECAKEEVTSMDIQQLKAFLSGVQLTKELGKRECYEIPVVAGQQITNIHLTIVHNKKMRGMVQVQMDSEQFGKVVAEFSVKNHILDGMVLCDSRKSADKMKEEQKDFIERLQEQGMEPGRITYGIKTGSMDAYSAQGIDTTEREETPVLYQLAKAFVKHVSYLGQSV